MTSIELTAPAKVNIFLKVLNKRKDSYHNILTIFEKISLADKIRLTKIPNKGIIVVSDKHITPGPKDNIAYKAAEAVLKKKRIRRGVKIEIKKRIPIGAGLGGGSSDAAAVLLGMCRLFNLSMGRDELIRIARQLGADVPFFLLNSSFAIGREKGDVLKAVKSKLSLWHLIIYPGVNIHTKDIYMAYDARSKSHIVSSGRQGPDFALTTGQGGVKIRFPLRQRLDFKMVESMLHNDLEGIVRVKKTVIDRTIKGLALTLGKRAIVSGSGSSLFCLYRTRKEAVEGKNRLSRLVPARERKGWRVFVVRTEG